MCVSATGSIPEPSFFPGQELIRFMPYFSCRWKPRDGITLGACGSFHGREADSTCAGGRVMLMTVMRGETRVVSAGGVRRGQNTGGPGLKSRLNLHLHRTSWRPWGSPSAAEDWWGDIGTETLWAFSISVPLHMGKIGGCPCRVVLPWGLVLKNLPAMQEMQIGSLSQEDPLEEGMVIHASILVCRIPWAEEPGGLQSMGSQRVGHN